jgi:hypothetical protein
MKVLTSCAGRFGDILWQLATVRAISETLGEPVDFCTTGTYGSIIPLVQAQPYIREAFAVPEWQILTEAPAGPPEPPSVDPSYKWAFHLSFRGWPAWPTLAEGYWQTARVELPEVKPLDLERPWITPPSQYRTDVAVGFGELWFELKYGLLELVERALPEVHFSVMAAEGSRWNTEGVRHYPLSWPKAASLIAGSKLFFGCLSAPWVLANALGKPTVIMEPAEPRHNSIFWLEHPRNTMVRGHDGRPTFDSRHCVDALRKKLGEVGLG